MQAVEKLFPNSGIPKLAEGIGKIFKQRKEKSSVNPIAPWHIQSYTQERHHRPVLETTGLMSFLGIGLNMPGGYGVDATFFFSLLVGCAASLP
jgi:hypothetical protein